MDEPVQENGQVNVTIKVHVRIQPVEKKNRRVVVNMQKTKLVPFFTKDNKKRVPKVPNFANVEQPKQIRNGWIGLIVGNTGDQ